LRYNENCGQGAYDREQLRVEYIKYMNGKGKVTRRLPPRTNRKCRKNAITLTCR